MAGIESNKLKLGDLICYKAERSSIAPEFMMWHRINDDGRPDLRWHSHKWKPGNLGVVIDVIDDKNKFLKIATQEGGLGWVLATWCTSVYET